MKLRLVFGTLVFIAGPALVESDKLYRPTGGTGVMVRTLLRYLEEA